MTLCIVRLTGSAALEVHPRFTLSEAVDFKLAKEEELGIEQENELIQPCNQQRDSIVAFYRNFSRDRGMYLLERHHQAFHTLSCVDEQFRQRLPKGMQANICCMVEYFVGLLRHCYTMLAVTQPLRYSTFVFVCLAWVHL